MIYSNLPQRIRFFPVRWLFEVLHSLLNFRVPFRKVSLVATVNLLAFSWNLHRRSNMNKLPETRIEYEALDTPPEGHDQLRCGTIHAVAENELR